MMKKKQIAWIAGIAAAVLLVAGVAVAVALSHRGYRSVKIYQMEGTAQISRGSQTVAPYADMLLKSGDRVETGENSYLYLKVDEDKYLMAEPETVFVLTAKGSAKNSRTKIEIEQGSVIHHITSPLGKNSEYEISTPNSTMAIRGTSFRICVENGSGENSHTELQVFDGAVEVRLVGSDGKETETVQTFRQGQTVAVAANAEQTVIESVKDEIDYAGLDDSALGFLRDGIRYFENFDISESDLDGIIEQKKKAEQPADTAEPEQPEPPEEPPRSYTVTFMNGNDVFGRQTVEEGKLAAQPKATPTPNGHWDFDFTVPILGDTAVFWVEEKLPE